MYETVVYSVAVASGAYLLARAMPGRRPVPGSQDDVSGAAAAYLSPRLNVYQGDHYRKL